MAAPLGLAVLACCGHRLLPQQLAVLPNGMVPGLTCPGVRMMRILGWSCVVRSFQGVWFMLRHYNHLFCFAATPDCPV